MFPVILLVSRAFFFPGPCLFVVLVRPAFVPQQTYRKVRLNKKKQQFAKSSEIWMNKNLRFCCFFWVEIFRYQLVGETFNLPKEIPVRSPIADVNVEQGPNWIVFGLISPVYV